MKRRAHEAALGTRKAYARDGARHSPERIKPFLVAAARLLLSTLTLPTRPRANAGRMTLTHLAHPPSIASHHVACHSARSNSGEAQKQWQINRQVNSGVIQAVIGRQWMRVASKGWLFKQVSPRANHRPRDMEEHATWDMEHATIASRLISRRSASEHRGVHPRRARGQAIKSRRHVTGRA